MIPFIGARTLVNFLANEKDMPQTRNADYDWYLSNAPAPVASAARDSWPLRLLPAFLRTPLKARVAARQYEQTLIAMWDSSPHLLEDIGVILAPAEGLADHLIAAPARVVEHVMAHGAIPAEQAAVRQTQPAMAPAPRTAATVQRSNTDRPRMRQVNVAT